MSIPNHVQSTDFTTAGWLAIDQLEQDAPELNVVLYGKDCEYLCPFSDFYSSQFNVVIMFRTLRIRIHLINFGIRLQLL